MNPQEVAQYFDEYGAPIQGPTFWDSEQGKDLAGTSGKVYDDTPYNATLLGLKPGNITDPSNNRGYVQALSDGRQADGSIDEEAFKRFQAQQRLIKKHTDDKGVFTPPKSVFGDLTQFAGHGMGGKKDSGNVHDFFSSVQNGRGAGGAELLDPKQIIHDPFYGDFTSRANLKRTEADTEDPLWKGINMASKAAASMATGGASSLLEGGVNYIGHGAESGQWGGEGLKNFGMSVAQAALGHYLPGMIKMLPGFQEVLASGNMAEIAKWIGYAKKAKTAYDIYNEVRG